MLRVSVDSILGATGGALLAGEREWFATGLSIDSRNCPPGCVYVAFCGEKADGHDYLRDAIESGARVLLITRAKEDVLPELTVALRRGVAVIRIDDPLTAVQQLAAYHRGRLLCPVVGVTGSTGKTTTKDFLRSVLATRLRVVSTRANHNNELGVPLTLFEAGTDTDVLVVEMGMRGTGQIRHLCDIARPTLGLLTNVGTSHVEVLGSREAVIQAKGELVEAIPAEGAVFLNGDDAASMTLEGCAQAPVTLYGLDEACSVRAEDIELDSASHPSFKLISPQGDVAVQLAVPGRHNVYNALAAAAVALRMAIPLESIAVGLERAEFSGMRMETVVTATGITVLNDAYNANPTSMKAAVDTLAAMQPTGKRIAVLGDMAELGNLTDLAHFEVGEAVGRSGIELLITVGRKARRICEGARAEGMDAESMWACEDVAEALGVLRHSVIEGDVVLVKGSRVMGMEAVVEGMVAPDAC